MSYPKVLASRETETGFEIGLLVPFVRTITVTLNVTPTWNKQYAAQQNIYIEKLETNVLHFIMFIIVLKYGQNVFLVFFKFDQYLFFSELFTLVLRCSFSCLRINSGIC